MNKIDKVCHNFYRHGETGTALHNRWQSFRRRVKHKQPGYEKLRVCKRWQSYELFREDMGESFAAHAKKFGEKNTTLDRISGKKGYNKNNCRWATCKAQTRNRSCTLFVLWQGEKIHYIDAVQQSGVNLNTFWTRVRRGWTPERALIPPK